MRTAGLAIVLAASLAACGGAAPEARSVVVAPPDNRRPAPLVEPQDEANRTTLEYIVVPFTWVERVAPAPAADVKTWGDVRENKKTIRTSVRHILIKVKTDGSDADAAKKKAEQALARLGKGEDFAKLAKELSEDPGSKDKGGLYAGDMVDMFVEPFRKAYADLAPGETVTDPVRTSFGWHVIRKEQATEDELAEAYRRGKAPDLAKKLAEEILARLRTADSTRAAIATAVESVLGDDAKENADRPHALSVVDKNIDALHLSQEARDALAKLAKTGRTGEVAAAAIPSKNAFVAARVSVAPPR